MTKIEIYKSKKKLSRQKWYFRVKASNGEIIASSEAYGAPSKALRAAQRMRTHMQAGEVLIVQVER